MKKTTTELGKVIAEAREKAGISQRELSRRANMDCLKYLVLKLVKDKNQMFYI